jgi:hypothetical protein
MIYLDLIHYNRSAYSNCRANWQASQPDEATRGEKWWWNPITVLLLQRERTRKRQTQRRAAIGIDRRTALSYSGQLIVYSCGWHGQAALQDLTSSRSPQGGWDSTVRTVGFLLPRGVPSLVPCRFGLTVLFYYIMTWWLTHIVTETVW